MTGFSNQPAVLAFLVGRGVFLKTGSTFRYAALIKDLKNQPVSKKTPGSAGALERAVAKVDAGFAETTRSNLKVRPAA
jgi:hypothetical protein